MSAALHRLGDLCRLVRGTSATLKTPPGDFPLVVTADFRRTAESWQLEGPAVCVPLISSTGHGDAALHRIHYQEGRFALANLLVALLPKYSASVDAKYLYRYLLAKKDQLFVPLMSGTANVSLKERDIADVGIPLPPLQEQRRIVAQIERLSNEVGGAQKLRCRADLDRASVLPSATSRLFGTLTARFPATRFRDLQPYITSGPRNWGKNYEASGYRFYRAQDIGASGVLVSDSKAYVVPPDGDQGRSAMPRAGDLLLVITGATVGRVACFDAEMEPGFVSQHVAICRLPARVVMPRFAWWGLRSPIGQDHLIGKRYGQGKPGLNLTNISDLALPLPPIKEQAEIVAEFDALESELLSLERVQSRTRADLEALLPAILDRAFSGAL